MESVNRQINVRRLAAVDMHGVAGTDLRRRVITAEFILGAIGGIALGAWFGLTSSGPVGLAFGIYLTLLGLNYVPLALTAIRLRSPSDLKAELRAADIRAELRHYTGAQFWVFVPGLLAYLAVRQR